MAHDLRDVGGTAGGLGYFLGGLAMAVAGGYLFLNQVTVYSSYWTFFGPQTFGLTLVPVLVGIGMLFFDGRSRPGWALMGLGMLTIFAGIIANLGVHFHGTSLYNTLVMLGLLAGGLGLIFRSLRPVGGARQRETEGAAPAAAVDPAAAARQELARLKQDR